MDKMVETLTEQSKIYRKLADLNDLIVIAIENDDDDELENLSGMVMVQYMKLQKLK